MPFVVSGPPDVGVGGVVECSSSGRGAICPCGTRLIPPKLGCVPRAMKYRDVARALRRHGATSKSGKGSHEKWLCPCGSHIAVVPRHSVVSPGVVGDVEKKMECLPKGWLT